MKKKKEWSKDQSWEMGIIYWEIGGEKDEESWEIVKEGGRKWWVETGHWEEMKKL